jgi:hypothetical protein
VGLPVPGGGLLVGGPYGESVPGFPGWLGLPGALGSLLPKSGPSPGFFAGGGMVLSGGACDALWYMLVAWLSFAALLDD